MQDIQQNTDISRGAAKDQEREFLISVNNCVFKASQSVQF